MVQTLHMYICKKPVFLHILDYPDFQLSGCLLTTISPDNRGPTVGKMFIGVQNVALL